MRWFEEDLALAEKVSRSWNAVVERGKADEKGCEYSRCEGVSGGSP